MIRIGVVGCGYWGPNLVRNFTHAPGSEVVAVCDVRRERLDHIRTLYPSIGATTDYRELLRMPGIDAIAIATPVSTHFDLAWQALTAGKHVLVEKPLAATTGEALRLTAEADRRKLTLMVDNTFVYTAAVRRMRDLVASGELGDVYYYDSVRVNLGLFQHDVNVLWDLAVHDLAILDFILPAKATAVSATGMRHVPNQPENIAYLTVFFENSLIAHVHANWMAPVKIRRTLIGGSQKMLLFDDLEPSEKIKIYDKGITIADDPATVYQMRIGYRTGDMWAPNLELTEALAVGARHFIDCVETGARPQTDGASGVRVVRILEAATRSMAERGRPVELAAIEDMA